MGAAEYSIRIERYCAEEPLVLLHKLSSVTLADRVARLM